MITVHQLCKHFKVRVRKPGVAQTIKSLVLPEFQIKKAVDNVSFHIEKGEIVGYIGENGAGKSTTIKMLSGILVPSSGEITVMGRTPHLHRSENAKHIGVVFGQRSQLWWDIPVRDSFTLMKHMYAIHDKQFKENYALFCDVLGIDQFIDMPVRQLSLGQKMRADLACSLLHNPDILYLDEPTIGLDVLVKEKIRAFIKEINQLRKTTIILTTHDMFDIEELSSRVMVIDGGSLMYDGSLSKLKEKYGNRHQIEIHTQQPATAQLISSLPVFNIEAIGDTLRCSFDKTQIKASQILSHVMKTAETTDFTVKEPNIDDIVRLMYQELPAQNIPAK